MTLRGKPAVPTPAEGDGRPPDQESLDFGSNRWSRTVVQPLLITFLVTALAGAFLIILEIFATPGWLLTAPFVGLATLEGVYTTLWLRQPGQRLVTRPLLRLSEVAAIILATIVLYHLIFTADLSETPLRDLVINPFLLLNPRLLILLVVTFVSWGLGNVLTRLFGEMAIDETEATFFLAPTHLRDNNARPVSPDRGVLAADFFRYWVWGGVLLTFLVALSTISLGSVGATIVSERPLAFDRLNLRVDMLVAVLVYLVSGFLLLSQARLAMYNARWLMSGARKAPNVERRWHRASIVLILLAGAVAAFLPLGSTFLLARIIQAIMTGIILAVSYLVFLVILLGSYIISLFASPDAPQEGVGPPEPVVPPPLPPPTEPLPPPPPSNAIPLVSILLWLLIIIAFVEAILFFLNTRGYRVPRHLLPALWRGLVRVWRALRRGARRQVAQMRVRLSRPRAGRAAPPRVAIRRRPGSVRWQRLSPREQIRYFYLATLRKAADEGVSRKPGQTPAEFAHSLEDTWPDEGQEIDDLTGAFIQARYSPRTIERQEAAAARSTWERLVRRLRKKGSNGTVKGA